MLRDQALSAIFGVLNRAGPKDDNKTKLDFVSGKL